MHPLVIGVLAFQGDFAKHAVVIQKLGQTAIEIRKKEGLAACDALIIPGGESSAMMHHIQASNFFESLQQFAQKKPIFGTCAGLILMSKEIIDDPMVPFGFFDIAVQRNAYGRQAESFKQEIELRLEGRRSFHFPAIFIRAPKIRRLGSGVKILAKLHEEPILIQEGFHLGASFHPELLGKTEIHEYFLQIACRQKKTASRG